MPEDARVRPIVFLGLSLGETEARDILDADYRGPVVAGDLDAISAPADVLIVDGILDPGSRLGLAEAERALERGIRLRGAASLGAVLASRLESQGMTATGLVFEALRDVEGSRSDLVRALYTADTLRSLTVPLVHALVHGRQRGLAPFLWGDLVDALRAIPPDARTWDRIRTVAVGVGLELPADPRLADYKGADARQALQRLAMFQRRRR